MRYALALGLLLVANSAVAQKAPALILGAGGGVAIPLGDFADDGANTGWMVNASASVRITRVLGAYASYERLTFGLDDSAASGGDDSWVDSGVGVGAQLWVPMREDARVQPWVRLGVGWHDLDPLIAGGAFSSEDTKGIRTLEGGVGLDIAVAGRSLFIRPTARYRRYSFSVTVDGQESSTSVSSLTLSLGAALALSAHRTETEGGTAAP